MDCKYCDIPFSTELPSCVRCGAPKPSEAIGDDTATSPETSTFYTSTKTYTSTAGFFDTKTYSNTTSYSSTGTHTRFGEDGPLHDLDIQSLMDGHPFPTEGLLNSLPKSQTPQDGNNPFHGHGITLHPDRNTPHSPVKGLWTSLPVKLTVLLVLFVCALIFSSL